MALESHTLPCRSKRKVLTRPAPVAGAAATKAAEARKDTELKKAAEAKKASADPADLSSAREETVAESQAADATASPVKPVDGSYPLPSVGRAERVTADVTPDEAQDPIVVPSSTEEEPSAAAGSGSPAPMKERRTKAARDPARPSDPAAPTGGAPSTEAVMQEGGTHESRGPPLSTLSFTELHAALGEVHVVSFVCSAWFPPSPRGSTRAEGASRVSSYWNQAIVVLSFLFFVVQAEVKRLTALVEEAAKKNRRLIALGSKYLFARALISAGVVSALALMIFHFL